MTRKYRLERTTFIGCRNTAYMDVDDAEPCPFCGSRQVTIYPYGQGTTSYVEGVPTLYLSSATCKCRGCTAEIDGPQRKSIIEGEDEYNACIAALKTWNTRYSEKGKEVTCSHPPCNFAARGGGFSLKATDVASIDELSPCAPRFRFL